MKYEQKTFIVPFTSKDYRDNWDDVFGSPAIKIVLQVGDLVGVRGFGCFWNGEGEWIENTEYSYWFGFVEEIELDDTKQIKIKYFDPDAGEHVSCWQHRDDIYFVKRDIEKTWKSRR